MLHDKRILLVIGGMVMLTVPFLGMRVVPRQVAHFSAITVPLPPHWRQVVLMTKKPC